MVISVQFKNKEMKFGGKVYDFKLADKVSPPKTGSIIRMLNRDGTKVVCHGTRVKVVEVKTDSKFLEPDEISYIESSLDEPSISCK